MTKASRLSSEDRRAAIVAAVTPLFARKGFAGATTRELAEVAGISEALLFKHFPNKDLLYQEILAQKSREGESTFRRLRGLEPSTASLIHVVHALVFSFVSGRGLGGLEMQHRHRLVTHSLLEDGAFARLCYDMVNKVGKPQFIACMKAAAKQGDLHPDFVAPERSFWLMHHLVTMMAVLRLPQLPLADVADPMEKVVEDTVRFLLRAIGLREEATKLHYHPKTLNAFLSPES